MGEIKYQQYVCRGVVHILADHLTLSQPGGVGRLCLSNNTGTPGFSDLPTALYYRLSRHKNILSKYFQEYRYISILFGKKSRTDLNKKFDPKVRP